MAGFGALLVLIGLSSAALYSRMEHVGTDLQVLQRANEESSRVLGELRSEIYLFAILLRDYLLESDPQAASEQRQSLEKLRGSTQDHLRSLEASAVLKINPGVQQLRNAVEDYWKSAEPAFLLTPAQKAAVGPSFLRRRVVPQRRVAFKLATEIQNVSLSQSLVRQSPRPHSSSVLSWRWSVSPGLARSRTARHDTCFRSNAGRKI
jgi:hypothetical protein